MEEPILQLRVVQEALLDILGEKFYISRLGWTITAGERIKFAVDKTKLRTIKISYTRPGVLYFAIVEPQPELNMNLSLVNSRYAMDQLETLISDVSGFIFNDRIPLAMIASETNDFWGDFDNDQD